MSRPVTRPRSVRRLLVATAFALLPLLALPALPAPGAAQALDRPLRVSVDCANFWCNIDYFVDAIGWVRFVRDRHDADIEVLGRRQTTGAGGGAFTFDFRGRGAFEGQRLTLHGGTAADATDADVRTMTADVLRLGLAPFAAATPEAPRVEVTPRTAADGEAQEEVDPWDRWSFRIGVNGFLQGETQQRFRDGSATATAGRVTDDWKVRFSARNSFSRSEFELDETTTFRARTESYFANGLAVRSVGERWGVGGTASWNRSTFNNFDTSVLAAPAVEYNIYPYAESTSRLLSLLYLVGPRYNLYRDTTIFAQTSELLLEHQLITSYDVTQPWGSIDTRLRITHYIARLGAGEPWPSPQYNVVLFGGLNLRLIRGLTANAFGRVELVRGQIQLAAAGLSPEEILTRQRELATSYRYFLSFGVAYRFGSIFSDVVNRRFDALQ